MLINLQNAALFASIFDKLSDTRFQMRTPAAIVKGSDLTEAAALQMALDLGLHIVSSREEPTKKFVVRPQGLTHAQAGELAMRAIGLNGDESFECSFIPAEPEQRDPTGGSDEDDGVDLFRDIENGLPN